ncbi:MAG: amidohydrolase family protein [Bacteroidia bacterium]|nr:amidohydrolase family protein [Bacteroidia bacterium]
MTYCILLLQVSLFAQIDYDIVKEPSKVLFINDVIIITESQDSSIRDILVRDGLIVKIADEIEAPFDAKVIEADSTYAYPSFIDMLSYTGLVKEERKENRDRLKFPGYPPNELAGITPERLVDEKLDIKSSSIKSMREAGFGISHTVPKGRMLPGQGSLISLSGKKNCIISNRVSMYMQLSGARGMYPSTLIGVMAKWRDLYRQAGQLKTQHEKFNEGGNGFPRPQRDKSLEALFNVVANQQNVYTKAEKVKDIFRVLELQDELGYNLVLSNVKQGWQSINKIKAQNASVALSLALPKSEKKDDKKESPKGDKRKKNEEKTERNKDDLEKEKKEDPETIAFKERKAKAIAEYEKQAAVFEEAGIHFGFSMLDTKPGDVKKNLNRMISSGLTRETALKALTIYPAEILGIDHIAGSISEGKMANFFLTDKPYFDKESNIRHIIIEGVHEKIKVKKKSKSKVEEGKYEELQGTWSYVVDIPEDRRTGEIIVNITGDEIEINLIDNQEPDEVEEATDIEIKENQLAFTIMVNEGNELPIRISLEFEGEDFSGTVSAEGIGSFPIDGKKIETPE